MKVKPTIGITGSSGFIGKRLVRFFAECGYTVRAFQRSPGTFTHPHITYYPFDLAAVADNGINGLEYMIHCAYQPAIGAQRGTNTNIEGTKKLIAACRANKVRMIFLSTLSAHERAKSQYGRDKLFLETLFTQPTDLVLKLGLVLGEGGGLFGRIANILQTQKIVPLVGGNKQIQTLALEDLCKVILHSVQHHFTGNKLVAHPEKISLHTLYKAIAAQSKKRPIFIPMPIRPTYYALLILERFGMRLPIHSENVLGVQYLETVDTQKDCRTFAITLQNYSETLSSLR